MSVAGTVSGSQEATGRDERLLWQLHSPLTTCRRQVPSLYFTDLGVEGQKGGRLPKKQGGQDKMSPPPAGTRLGWGLSTGPTVPALPAPGSWPRGTGSCSVLSLPAGRFRSLQTNKVSLASHLFPPREPGAGVLTGAGLLYKQ